MGINTTVEIKIIYSKVGSLKNIQLLTGMTLGRSNSHYPFPFYYRDDNQSTYIPGSNGGKWGLF